MDGVKQKKRGICVPDLPDLPVPIDWTEIWEKMREHRRWFVILPCLGISITLAIYFTGLAIEIHVWPALTRFYKDPSWWPLNSLAFFCLAYAWLMEPCYWMEGWWKDATSRVKCAGGKRALIPPLMTLPLHPILVAYGLSLRSDLILLIALAPILGIHLIVLVEEYLLLGRREEYEIHREIRKRLDCKYFGMWAPTGCWRCGHSSEPGAECNWERCPTRLANRMPGDAFSWGRVLRCELEREGMLDRREY